MVDNLLTSDYNYNSISQEDYAQFEKYWVIYALQDKRYGQAFCEHFNLGNSTPLYHFKGVDVSQRWIDVNYLKK